MNARFCGGVVLVVLTGVELVVLSSDVLVLSGGES